MTVEGPALKPVAGVVCILVFLAIAGLLIANVPLPYDRAISEYVAAHRTSGIVDLAFVINLLGSQAGIAIGLALVGGLILPRDPKLAMFIIVTTLALAFGIELIKVLIARPRPPEVLFGELNYSYPSSHTAVTTYFYGWVWLLSRQGQNPRRRATAKILVPLIVLGVGAGRVVVSAHWPSDVMGGFFLGLGALIFASTIPGRMQLNRFGDSD